MVLQRDEVADVYNTPLLELVYQAASVHRMYNDPAMVRAGTGRVECSCTARGLQPAVALLECCCRCIEMVPRMFRTMLLHASVEGPPEAPLLSSLQVQRCTLLSIKTGGCPENCGYCSQSRWVLTDVLCGCCRSPAVWHNRLAVGAAQQPVSVWGGGYVRCVPQRRSCNAWLPSAPQPLEQGDGHQG